MPQFELHMTRDALAEQARADLLRDLTHLLLRMEGAPATPEALDITWGTVVEYAPGDWVVGGEPAVGARYRLVFTVPQGATGIHGPAMWGRREAFVKKATAAILAAEGTPHSASDAGRVWVQILEIPNGFWGAFDELTDVMDIATYIGAPVVRTPTEKGLRARRAFAERDTEATPVGTG